MRTEEEIDNQVRELGRTGNPGFRGNRFADMYIEIGNS